MDRLSDLPLSIIETILCLIPIQEAGRTSILSREWRYRWTKIPKLVFEENTFQVSIVDGAELSILEQKHLEPNERQKTDMQSKLIYAVGQVLLMHDGPIHEFTLSLVKYDQHVKIDRILTHLSRKTSIEKLKLYFAYTGFRLLYRLPSSIFSFHQLTDLCLIGCYFDHRPTFNEFGSLTSLYLQYVFISTRTLQQLLSSCPLLKTVILDIRCSDTSRSNDGPTFTELYECLFECLPVIETLSLPFDLINVFDFENCVDCRVPRELPTPLFHLKYVTIDHVCFTHNEELILALLIKSSPNLEKIKIYDDAMSETSKESSSRVECYQGIMLEHLNELEIMNIINHRAQVDFVKLIMARSPVLKKVRILPHYHHEKLQISEILLRSPRASPEVQIIVEDRRNWCWRTADLVAP